MKYWSLLILCMIHFFPTKAQHVFDTQAHRGGKKLYPENTIPAMLNALHMGVQTLEMDLQITKDKQVVLSHDAYLNPEITTRPDGSYIDKDSGFYFKIYDMLYDSLRTYDVGLKPYPNHPEQQKIPVHKPLLADVLEACEAFADSCKRAAPIYNIETKTRPFSDDIFHPKPEEFVRLMMDVIVKKGIEKRVIIQSFDPRTLEIVHKKYPFIKTALLVEKVDDHKIAQQRKHFEQVSINRFKEYPNHMKGVIGDLQFLSFIPAIYSPDHRLVTPELIKACHRKGMKVIPWTINDKARLQQLKAMGIDGAITDDPRIFF